MTWTQRVRADLARPEVPAERELFLVGAAVAILITAQLTRPGTAFEILALVPAVGACTAVGLGWRLRSEWFALLVIVPVTLVVGHRGNLEVAMFLPVMVTLYSSWYLGSTIRATAILLAALVSPWLIADVLTPETQLTWAPWTGAAAFTFALGRTLRQQRFLIAQLEEAREALADRAVAEERRRIARELHDLAGHTLAAVLLHVTGARHVMRRDPDEANRALLDAEAVGRASLDQIRATVAALRTDERGTDPALAGSADLTELIAAYRRAGLRIDTRIDPAAAHLSGPVGTALHRIAQESLANVARHAPDNQVTVALARDSALAYLTITDRGRPPTRRDDGLHFGLVGMRERARAVGGKLDAGPRRDGWRVAARLPLADPASDAPHDDRPGGTPPETVDPDSEQVDVS